MDQTIVHNAATARTRGSYCLTTSVIRPMTLSGGLMIPIMVAVSGTIHDH